MIKIEWDDTKCTNPLDCCKCLNSCSEGVFMTYPRDPRGPGKEPGNWAVIPSFLSLCTGCRVCEDVCPQEALVVNVLEEATT